MWCFTFKLIKAQIFRPDERILIYIPQEVILKSYPLPRSNFHSDTVSDSHTYTLSYEVLRSRGLKRCGRCHANFTVFNLKQWAKKRNFPNFLYNISPFFLSLHSLHTSGRPGFWKSSFLRPHKRFMFLSWYLLLDQLLKVPIKDGVWRDECKWVR